MYEAWDKSFRFDIESGTNVYNKRRWISKTPDILTFNILRLVYDHETQMPKKLHNEFTFDNEIYIDRFVAKNASRFPDFMNSLDKLKSKKQVLEKSLKKYTHDDQEYTKFLTITRQFVEKQIYVDEESKETSAPDEHDMLLWNPDEIGKIGMKKSELESTISCLKKYEKHLQQSMEIEKEALQQTINDLGKC